MKRGRILIFLYALCLLTTTATGQIPETPTTNAPSGGLLELNEYDSIEVYFFYPAHPEEVQPFSDTLLDHDFQQYDPIRQEGRLDAHLGWLGTAHRDMIYQPLLRKGFDMGLHQFDRYKIFPSQLRYYRLRKAWTDLFFSQGIQQNDGLIKATFGRDFAKGIHFSADYSRINNINASDIRLLSDNIYNPPTARNTSVAAGIWIEKQQYDGFFSYASNIIQQQENGGIRDDSIFLVDLDFKTAEIFLNEALTRHTDNTLSYIHHLRFSGKSDSLTGIPGREYRASHALQYHTFIHKYADTAPDTAYYPEGLLTDLRGMRFFLSARTLENQFSLSTYRLRPASDTTGGLYRRDLLEVGLLHRWIWLQQEPLDSNLQNLLLTGSWDFRPGERLRLETGFHYGLLFANRGDYLVHGILSLDLPRLGGIAVSLHQQLYSPSLTAYRMFLTQRPVWENDFRKTLETHAAGSLRIAPLRLEIQAGYHLLNNVIYYNSAAVPAQSGIPVNILQLGAKWDLRLGPFHLDTRVTLQEVTEEVIRLPRLVSVNSLYYEGKWFRKVLLMRIGCDLRYTDAYRGTAFLPLTGQFYLQDEQSTRLRAVDFFLSTKVRGFRLFAKIENVLPLYSKEVYYLVPHYPLPDLYFRLGISWHMHQ